MTMVLHIKSVTLFSFFIYLCNSRSSLDQLQKQNKQKTVDKSDIEQIF